MYGWGRSSLTHETTGIRLRLEQVPTFSCAAVLKQCRQGGLTRRSIFFFFYFPRRSPSPLLSPRRLLPRRPAALLPRRAAAASPRLVLALRPVCFAVIPSPCCSYSSSCAAVTVEAGQNACARYHFVGISPAPRSERRRFVAIFFRLRLCCYINAGRPRFSLPCGAIPTGQW